MCVADDPFTDVLVVSDAATGADWGLCPIDHDGLAGAGAAAVVRGLVSPMITAATGASAHHRLPARRTWLIVEQLISIRYDLSGRPPQQDQAATYLAVRLLSTPKHGEAPGAPIATWDIPSVAEHALDRIGYDIP